MEEYKHLFESINIIEQNTKHQNSNILKEYIRTKCIFQQKNIFKNIDLAQIIYAHYKEDENIKKIYDEIYSCLF